MSAFLNQQLTNVGWDALSTALGGGRLTFYKMQAGQGTIANDAAIPPMTALVAPVCDIPISSYIIEGDGQITLFGNINSAELPTGFTFRELGVFAAIEAPVPGKGGVPSGPNIQAFVQAPGTTAVPVVPPPAEGTALMYSYCNSYAASDYIPGSGESTDVTNTVQVTIKIDQAQDVQINILQGEQMAVVNIGPPSVGAGPWSYTQANVAYLKRLVAGPVTEIHEDANTITIGQKQLTADLDLYVANGNPDISPNFSSIQKALNYLSQYIIPTTVRARINVSAGTYTAASRIVVDHPNSQSITIQGPQNTKVTGTSISITGSANNWNMLIGGIGNTSQFKVNDWAIVDRPFGITNLSDSLVTGFFKVIAVTANSVTLRIPNPKASFSVIGLTGITVTPISVVLTSSTVNEAAISIGAYGIRLFQYIGIVATVPPTLSMAGFYIGGVTSLTCVGIYGFDMPINSRNDNLMAGLSSSAICACVCCAFTQNQCGCIGSGGVNYQLDGCAFSYNNFRALYIEGGGAGFVYNPTYFGGNWHGVVSSGNASMGVIATVPPGYVFCANNDFYGLWCHGGGGLSFSNPVCTFLVYNNSISQPIKYDVVVTNYGLVNGNVCIIGSRIFNSPVGVINGTGGLIN